MKSYAQLRQDLFPQEFFKYYPPKHKIFIDCGAFDGIGYSNTRLFFEEGWSGICIESCQKNYEKLERLCKETNVIIIKAAISDFEGEKELNIATIPGSEDWGSDVSSLTDDVIQRWPDYIWEKEIVSVTTLNKILNRNAIENVDFISIDVEGHEMAVLRGFDLNKYKPHLMVVEYSSSEEKI